jgi:hypothetical protein
MLEESRLDSKNDRAYLGGMAKTKRVKQAKVVRMADLKDQRGPGPHPSLHCDECGGDYSANRGDYWMLNDEHVFTCCGVPMRLVLRITHLVNVET